MEKEFFVQRGCFVAVVFQASEAKSLKRHDGETVLVENFLFEFGDGAGFENGCGG